MVSEYWGSADETINVTFRYTMEIKWKMSYVRLPFWSMRKQPGAKDFLGFYFRRYQIHIVGTYANGDTAHSHNDNVETKWAELREYYEKTFSNKSGCRLVFDPDHTTFRFECARRRDAMLIKMQLG